MKLHLKKQSDKFIPFYKSDIEEFKRLKNNNIYIADIRNDRNYQFHKKLFAIAKLIIENLPEGHIWENKEPYQLIKSTEFETGNVETRIKLNGEVFMEPESISFESWTEDRFQIFYEKALKIWSEKFNYSIEELESNHEEYL